jgi:hypothetical protein
VAEAAKLYQEIGLPALRKAVTNKKLIRQF